MGQIGGFCHLYIGQEAVVVGMQMAIREGDQVITAYRDHGHMLACGMDPKGVMAELTGGGGGYSKGKGGSMHMFSVEKGFYGGHGIVGAQVPLGTGLRSPTSTRATAMSASPTTATARRTRARSTRPSIWRQLWRLPVVYVIENNKYGMGTRVDRVSAVTDLSQRGASFNIPGEQVDGMDVRAVRRRAKKPWPARDGKGPYILEMLTYRYRGHSMSDPAKYRTKEEVEKMRHERDPIEHVRVRLLETGRANENDLKTIDKEIRAIVNEAADFAQRDPEPDAAELYTDVLR